MKKNLLLFVLCFILTQTITAKVTLPALLSDNMVLQQQTRIKVWGWSEPNASVEVSASWGEKNSTKADDEGNWLVTIATPAASYIPYTITVSDGEPVVIDNILIGEVWLCSGQSNMEMTFNGYVGSGVSGANQAIAESGFYPGIRLFKVGQKSAVEPQKDCTGNWNSSSPEVVKSFSVIGYFYALQLHHILNVPVGIINSSWGGTIIEAWMDTESQKAFTDVDLNLLNDEKSPVFNKPVSLYNGMIVPLVNYVVRGFIWYQGESNVPRYSTYADKMVAMIELWRTKWGDDRLPFFYAEIAPFNYASNQLDLTDAQINAALLREQQKHVMEMIDNVGMVCTNDLVYPYEMNEIHPSNKLEVARRFSYWALHDVYGFGDAVSAIGPQFRSMKVEENRAMLSFEDASREECFIGSKGDITGFEIAGSDRVFYPAKAIKERSFSRGLTVTSEQVDKPVAVRYCFKNFLLGNVFDAFGHPLVPFRTDDW